MGVIKQEASPSEPWRETQALRQATGHMLPKRTQRKKTQEKAISLGSTSQRSRLLLRRAEPGRKFFSRRQITLPLEPE